MRLNDGFRGKPQKFFHGARTVLNFHEENLCPKRKISTINIYNVSCTMQSELWSLFSKNRNVYLGFSGFNQLKHESTTQKI